MIVIAKNTEEKFHQALTGLSDDDNTTRCYHLRFSNTDLDPQILMESFLRLLNEVPNSYTSQVFICHDCDVFILMKGFMQRHFDGFITLLQSDIDAEDLLQHTAVYEIGQHKAKLIEMCRIKLEALLNSKADDDLSDDARSQKQKETHILSSIEALDPVFVKSINSRRNAHNTACILVVDDDQLSRTLAGNVLIKDYKVHYAEDGQSAIAGYVQHAPDVVFLDIELPDFSGHEALETILQIDPDAYVIMFSGRGSKKNILKALEAGAQGFLGKPFTREKLREYVSRSPFVQRKTDMTANAVGL